MKLSTVTILSVAITTLPAQKLLEFVKQYKKKPLVIVTPNPEQLVFAQQDKKFATILNKADIAIPDGIGLVLADRFFGQNKLQARIAGIDFMEALVKIAAQKRDNIAFLGAKHGIALNALERLKAKYDGLRGWAIDPPQLALEDLPLFAEHVAKKIKESGARYVFVGLGAPKQEYLIDLLVQLLPNNACVYMTVGGSFDILAGNLQRAPVVMRLIGFEWLYRLIREPWRWKRQRALVSFILLVVKRKVFYTL